MTKYTYNTKFFQLVRVKNYNNQTTDSQDIIDFSYEQFYNTTTVTNTKPHIPIDYRPKSLLLDIVNERFIFQTTDGLDFNTDNLLFFEKDVIYTIDLGSDYLNSSCQLGFKVVQGSNISIYNPVVFTEIDSTITLRFNEEVKGLFLYNVLDEFDNLGANYPTINVYPPESIHYYTRVDIDRFKFYRYNSLGSYEFNGQLEWEDAYSYLINKKQLRGKQGHSPLLGYAFDGFPIWTTWI